jgi:hypothetical protein
MGIAGLWLLLRVRRQVAALWDEARESAANQGPTQGRSEP